VVPGRAMMACAMVVSDVSRTQETIAGAHRARLSKPDKEDRRQGKTRFSEVAARSTRE
jgi:hypothetical protein